MKKLIALAGAGMLLAACSTDPSSAAVVAGDNITIDELAQVQEDFRAEGLNTDAGAVLSLLIQAELAEESMADMGIEISEEMQDVTIAQLSLNENVDYEGRTETLINYFALSLMLDTEQISQDEAMALVSNLSQAAAETNVDVNPRFGEWDGAQLSLVQPTRDYLIQVTQEDALGL